MDAGDRRKPFTNHGPIKPLPDKQLLSTLRHFVDVLESEKQLIFNHHLGVHSGTAVVEDLLARKLFELCNRAHTLITMKDNCMDVFLRFCEDLTTEKRNSMLTAFSVFDKGDLLDYVQLVKPHFMTEPITVPMRPAEPRSTAMWSTAAVQSTTAAGDHTKPATIRFKEPVPSASRVESLRQAGHPFLMIVDRLIKEKQSRPEVQTEPVNDVDSVIGAVRNGVITDTVAGQVHAMLKTNLAARRKWLGGMPLHLALLDNSSPPRSGRSLLSATPRSGTPEAISEHHEC